MMPSTSGPTFRLCTWLISIFWARERMAGSPSFSAPASSSMARGSRDIPRERTASIRTRASPSPRASPRAPTMRPSNKSPSASTASDRIQGSLPYLDARIRPSISRPDLSFSTFGFTMSASAISTTP
jgi:hypothetical protein